jgi:hypothetical protein
MASSAQKPTREDLLREVNERMAEVGSLDGDLPLDFICECSDESCVEKVTMTVLEFTEATRRGQVLAPGHRV